MPFALSSEYWPVEFPPKGTVAQEKLWVWEGFMVSTVEIWSTSQVHFSLKNLGKIIFDSSLGLWSFLDLFWGVLSVRLEKPQAFWAALLLSHLWAFGRIRSGSRTTLNQSCSSVLIWGLCVVRWKKNVLTQWNYRFNNNKWYKFFENVLWVSEKEFSFSASHLHMKKSSEQCLKT